MLMTPWLHSIPGRKRKGPMMSDTRRVKAPKPTAPRSRSPGASALTRRPFSVKMFAPARMRRRSAEAPNSASGSSSHQEPSRVMTCSEALRRSAASWCSAGMRASASPPRVCSLKYQPSKYAPRPGAWKNRSMPQRNSRMSMASCSSRLMSRFAMSLETSSAAVYSLR